MSKNNFQGQGQGSGPEFTDRVAEEIAAEKAWQAVCAKIGMPDAMGIRAGGTQDELHEQRKTLRRAVNKLTEHVGVRNCTNEENLAYLHAGLVSAKIDGMLDGFESPRANASSSSWRNADGKPLKLLKTEADFRAHYASGGSGEASDINLVDFFRGVANMSTTPAVRNALSIGTNTAGGFAVPSVLMPEIFAALAPNSSLMQAGMPIIPLDPGGKSFTTAVVSTLPTAAWRLEAGNVAESDPAFTGVVATPQSLSFYFKLSRELFQDAANLGPALLVAIGQAMAKAIDLAGLRGSGTAPTPRGLLNTSGIQSVTNGANGASLAGYANFLTAVQQLLTADAPMPTAAIMAPRSLVKLGGLLDTTNQPLRRPPMLDAVNMLVTSQIPVNLTVGTSTDCSEIYMGDFSKMALMVRESLSVQLLSERFADTGQVAFICHCRADFAVFYPSAFAVITGIRA